MGFRSWGRSEPPHSDLLVTADSHRRSLVIDSSIFSGLCLSLSVSASLDIKETNPLVSLSFVLP